MNAAMIGEWFAARYRTLARRRGVFFAATLMAAQNVPIHIAVATLARR